VSAVALALALGAAAAWADERTAPRAPYFCHLVYAEQRKQLRPALQ